MTVSRIVVDGRHLGFEPGDSVALAILRAGAVPGRGGTLCLAGDCGNCLGVVDGIAYVRTRYTDRVEAGCLLVGKQDRIGNEPHGWPDRKNPCPTCDVFLENIVLNRAGEG